MVSNCQIEATETKRCLDRTPLSRDTAVRGGALLHLRLHVWALQVLAINVSFNRGFRMKISITYCVQ